MNHPPIQQAPPPGSKAITLLRVILWLLPAFMLPFLLIFAGSLRDMWPLAVIVGLAAYAAVGYFDQRLSLQQKRLEPTTEKKHLIRWTIAFTLLQILIAPAVAMSVLYGFCAITVQASIDMWERPSTRYHSTPVEVTRRSRSSG